ncbi:thiol-disulfide oxidoreductase DCC family protein [Streptoalloteichus hindustanus]|uniref:Predicted thiol-disulfide oxidoreductase YuxK, DCC family n=1 Tax=Streptoalloteichus hindustanus TaxID=2017 RepID=A0A1M4VQT2_STRHI|nr:DUF393 domain-containing protein [Streptoalloteichus hindustanus]SHE71414.1 Predicted thiol-disulfide oxidoreductase YuxK, DCC family [Streptoalloteichus hindustanus]
MHGKLLFDGHCGFCTRCRNWLERLDRHGRVETVAYQLPGTAERYGLTTEQLASSVWWIDENGMPRASAAEAVNYALSAALGTSLPLRVYRLPGMRRLQEAAYRWVANNRFRFPGTTPWCQRGAAECG